ncbi:hypothetical protein ACOMHN_017570 [Nucella lapillus]
MIKFIGGSLLYRPSALHFACSKCKQRLGLGAALETAVPHCQFSTVKQPAKVKQNRSKAHVQLKQRSRGPNPKLTDPLRPVSDKLLQSLRKRHQEKFAGLAGTENGSMSASKLSALSAQDLIQAIYTNPKETDKKVHLENVENLLTKRLYDLTLHEALQACHGFYLHEHRFYRFLSHTLSIVDERFHDLTPSESEITRLLFYVFIQGSAPSMLLHKVEEYLLKNLDRFHINDLGIICIGFFRANSRLSSQDLLDAVAGKLLADLNSLEPFLLLDFVKTLRHASYIKVSFYEQLADHLVESNFMSKYTTLNPIMHIAFAYASIPVQHTALFEHLFSHAERLVSQRTYMRTKDVSKFVWACGTLQFRPDNHEQRYGQLVERFEANGKDNVDFPESMAEMLMGLVYLGLFRHGLIHNCLSPDVTSKLLERSSDREKSFQLLLLNEAVKMECPDYSGNSLTESQTEALRHHPSVSRDLEAELQTRVGLLAVFSCLQRCLGDDRVQCRHPFIHFKTAVVELWHSEQHGFVHISPDSHQTWSPSRKADTFTQKGITDDLYSALANKSVKTSDPSPLPECRRVAVVVTSSSQFALNDQSHPLGHLHTMLRHLNLAGYTVVEILPEDALCLEMSSHEERCRQLSALLSSVLHTNILLS